MTTANTSIDALQSPSTARGAVPRWLLVILAHRRLILAVALTGGALLAAYALLRPTTYTSVASFVPQARRTQSGASALAAQLGLSLPGADANGTPAYYADLAKSRSVLQPLVEGKFVPPASAGPSAPRDLASEFHVRATEPRVRAMKTMVALRRALAVNVSPKTGVVTLEARASSPWMAQAIADSVLASLDRFNIAARRAQAREEFRFTESRLEEVRAQLRAAEEREQAFLQQNRDYRNSPQLSFQHERLARDVALQQQVFASLSQSSEQMKVEQVRDTPLLTVLDRPDFPAMRDARER